MKRPTTFAVLRASCAVLAVAATSCGNGHTNPSSPALTVDASAGHDAGGDAGTHQSGDVTHDGANPLGELADGGPSAQPGADGGLGGPNNGMRAGGADAQANAAPATAIRFADWAPDAPAGGYDICSATPGDLTFTGPLLGSGIGFPQVGRYIAIAPGSYGFRVVAAGSDCSTAVLYTVGVPSVDIATNQHFTIALVGTINPMGSDPPAQLAAFMDDVGPMRGQAKLRFINASPAATVVTFGTGSMAAGNFTPLASDVRFGTAASATLLAEAGAPDSNGYLSLAPLMGGSLSAQPIPAMTDLATGSNVSVPAGAVDTIVLVNGGSDNVTPQMVLLQDDAPPQGMLSPSAVLAP